METSANVAAKCSKESIAPTQFNPIAKHSCGTVVSTLSGTNGIANRIANTCLFTGTYCPVVMKVACDLTEVNIP